VTTSHAGSATPSAGRTGVLDRCFHLAERGTTPLREIRGGLVTFFAMVYILVLAFGNGRSVSKKNWARATLVWGIIASVLVLVLYAVMGASLLALSNSNAG